MKKLLVALFCFPVLLVAQETNGIKFIRNMNWGQVLSEAKMTGKFVFIDCYATWCVPCKKMDSEVFSQGELGDFVNEKYVAVKIQMDSTKDDTEGIRRWYEEANYIQKVYKVASIPTYLFIDPNGKLVHKATGYKTLSDFSILVRNAIDTNKQFFVLLERYRNGVRNYVEMEEILNSAIELKEVEIVKEVGSDYINNYLANLKKEDIYKEGIINLIVSVLNVHPSYDLKLSDLFYHNSAQVDSVMGRGYSSGVFDYIITKVEIEPIINITVKGKDPNWRKCTNNIKEKYTRTYAEKIVLAAKIYWYRQQEHWKKYVKYSFEQIEKSGIDSTNLLNDGFLNNMVWEGIFLHNSNKKTLDKGLVLMEGIIRRNPTVLTYFDTYANLLYKAGDTKKAIEVETVAIESALIRKEEAEKQNNKVMIKFYSDQIEPMQVALDKMSKGIPTWISGN